MIQKFYVALTTIGHSKMVGDDRLLGSKIVVSGVGETLLAVVYPAHAHLRFAFADDEGIEVLPSHHDPTPVGDAHRHLAHVNAKPTETMREVALRLHDVHGPNFHPDT